MFKQSTLLTPLCFSKALFSKYLLHTVMTAAALFASPAFSATISADAFEPALGDGKCSLQEAVIESSNIVRIRNTKKDVESSDGRISQREQAVVDVVNDILVESAQLTAEQASDVCGDSIENRQEAVSDFFERQDANLNVTTEKEQAVTDVSNTLAGDEENSLCVLHIEAVNEGVRLAEQLANLESQPEECSGLDGRSDRISLENGTHKVTQALSVLSRLTIQPAGSDDLIDEVDVTIEGDGTSRLFVVDVDEDSTTRSKGSLKIVAATLAGGNAGATSTATVTDGLGGAIYCRGGLDLIDVVFDANEAVDGGAIYVSNQCTFSSERVDYTNNSASRNGGALYLATNASPFRGEMYSNTAGQDGGAIFVETGRLELDIHRLGDVDKGNAAGGNGGAIALAAANSGASFDIQRTSIAGNSAGGNGGGLSLLPAERVYYDFVRETYATKVVTTTVVTATESNETQTVTPFYEDENGELQFYTEDAESFAQGVSVNVYPVEIGSYVIKLDFDNDTTVVTTEIVTTSTVTTAVVDGEPTTTTVTTSHQLEQTVTITRQVGIFPNESKTTQLIMENVTVAQNTAALSGGGVYSVMSGPRLLNNVTVMENAVTAGLGAGIYLDRLGEYSDAVPEDGGDISVLQGALFANTVIGFNSGGENCELTVADDTSTVTQSYRIFSNDISCEGESARFNQIALGSSADQFFTAKADGTYDATFGGYAPIASTDLSIRAYDKGASETDDYPCKDVDMRIVEVDSGFDSIFRYEQENFICDIGAVEHQEAKATEDEYTDVPNNVPICLNVLANDVKDGTFNPEQGDFLSFDGDSMVLTTDSTRDGRAQVVMDCDADGDGVSDFADQDLDNDGIAGEVCSDEDGDGVPDSSCDTLGILYTPDAAEVLQRDSFNYFASVDGKSATATQVSVFTGPPRNTFPNYSKGSILPFNDAGSFSWVWLMLLSVFSLLARLGKNMMVIKRLIALSVSVFAVTATQAVEIIVDSCSDNAFNAETQALNTAALSDGVCTLREALLAAKHNDGVLYDKTDCEQGNTGRDQIILDVPQSSDDAAYARCGEVTGFMTILLDGTLVSDSLVDIVCRDASASDDEDDEDDTYNPRVDFPLCTITRDTDNTEGFTLVRAERATFMSGITFENGLSEINGGAIVAEQPVALENVQFKNNQAQSGGAIFLRGDRADLSIVGGFFENNTAVNDQVANAGGGAIASATNIESEISIDSVTFRNNSAVGASDALTFGGALFLRTIDDVSISNSTFTENAAPNGAAFDVSGVRGDVDLRNLTIIGNTASAGGSAISGIVPTSAALRNSVLADNAPINCDGANGARGYNRYDDDSCEVIATTQSVTTETVTVTATSPTTTTETVTTTTVVAVDPVELDSNLASYFELVEDAARPWPYFTVSDGSEEQYSDIIENQIPNDLREVEACASFDDRTAVYVDQFSVQRTSGGACDVGAIEQVRLTANDDGGEVNEPDRADNRYDNPLSCRYIVESLGVDSAAHKNYASPERVVFIDVYGNDLLQGTNDVADTSVLTVVTNETEAPISYIDQVADAQLWDEYLTTQLERNEVITAEQQSDLEECLEDRKAEFPQKVALFDGTGLKVGTYTFTYELSDVAGNETDTAQVTVTLRNTNPVARDDELMMPVGDASGAIDVFVNDFDPDGESAPQSGDFEVFDIGTQCVADQIVIDNSTDTPSLNLVLERSEENTTLTVTTDSRTEEAYTAGSATMIRTSYQTSTISYIYDLEVTPVLAENSLEPIDTITVTATDTVTFTSTLTVAKNGSVRIERDTIRITVTTRSVTVVTSTITVTNVEETNGTPSVTTSPPKPIVKTVPKLEVVSPPALGGVYINDSCQLVYFPSRLVNGVSSQIANTEFTYRVYDDEYYIEDADYDAFQGVSNDATVFVNMTGPGSEDSEQCQRPVSAVRGIGFNGGDCKANPDQGGALPLPLLALLMGAFGWVRRRR